MIIDKNLNWEEHISNVRTKVSRAIGFLKYSRKFLPQNTLSKMYSGIDEPHFWLLFGMGVLRGDQAANLTKVAKSSG